MFKALDANFRMVRLKVSSEAADPSLSDGYSYFGEIKKYYAHLEKHAGQIVQVNALAVCIDILINMYWVSALPA